MRVLVTGGCGLLGHHVIEHLLKNTNYQIITIDRLSYASAGFDRLRDIQAFDDKRVRTLAADINGEWSEGLLQEIGDVDYVLHLAAETHVDNSIVDAFPFVQSNVIGTFRVLEFCRQQSHRLKLMIYCSTDEVYGPAAPGVDFKEGDPLNPTNPYAAAKAGGEMLCNAYRNTHDVPVITTNTMNLFGERQHPEKFIPKVIRHVLAEELITIHADPTCTHAGSRFYLHCRNYADAALFLMNHYRHWTPENPMERFNVVGEREIDNLALATLIAETLGKRLRYELVDFHSSRPGHDLRYALDGKKLARRGWKHPVPVAESLRKTIEWYLQPENTRWLNWDFGKTKAA